MLLVVYGLPQITSHVTKCICKWNKTIVSSDQQKSRFKDTQVVTLAYYVPHPTRTTASTRGNPTLDSAVNQCVQHTTPGAIRTLLSIVESHTLSRTQSIGKRCFSSASVGHLPASMTERAEFSEKSHIETKECPPTSTSVRSYDWGMYTASMANGVWQYNCLNAFKRFIHLVLIVHLRIAGACAFAMPENEPQDNEHSNYSND